MDKTHDFITKYLTLYLAQCQLFNPLVESKEVTCVPPTAEEVEELVTYLSKNKVDFTIIGSVAVARYLELTSQDIHNQIFRPTHTLDMLVTAKLPQPPEKWRLMKENKIVVWISPGGGWVEFFKVKDIFPKNFSKIGKDTESEIATCPVADILTLFKMKLNTNYENDALELITLIRKFGYPKNIEQHLWSETQFKNLKLIKMWTKLRLGFDT